MKIDDFADRTPSLAVEDYFAGRTLGYGLFEDRFGTVRRQFTVEIDGEVTGDTLVLDERFHYADGERDRRVWTIVRTAPGFYEGRAGDVIGMAHGHARGNALNWTYDMNLKVGNGTWRVAFDDWMFLQPDGVLMNRARISKWGFDIGTVTLVFLKSDAALKGAMSAPPPGASPSRAAGR